MNYKTVLSEDFLPKAWYNIVPDLSNPPLPPLHPGTGQPIGPDDLSPIFPMSIIGQEVSGERWIEIPEPVRDAYRLWRPTPLHRAVKLEQALDTPAKIFYKNESIGPQGSHKTNTAIPQAFYNKEAGIKRVASETGAGQWGSAISFACNYFGLDCTVYMVKVSYEQKPYRRSLMQTWGATIIPSPSDLTDCGKKILSSDPNSPGSLGIAISEAVEDAVKHEDTKYSLGSVLNHVLLHQSVIGLETKEQLNQLEIEPDVMIACNGGGSNFGGFIFPFITDKTQGKIKTRFLAIEPAACPTLTKGTYAYDFGDTAQMTPLVKMHTLGHDFIPSGIHAGGLRYHGDSPLVSQLYNEGIIEAKSYHQKFVFEAAVQFARAEGIVPAPESSHAIRAAIDEALEAKAEGKTRNIVFNLSGHGHFDLSAYDAYFNDSLEDYEYPEEKIAESLKKIPQVG